MSKGKVIVRHKVRDLAAWKPFFLGDAKRQRDAGFTSWHLTRNKDDMSELVIIFECTDLDRAKPMFSDPSLAEVMKKAGVLDQPTVFFLEEIETGVL
jgi:hypothetical protein